MSTEKLRSAANRCTRVNAEITAVCEYALGAAAVIDELIHAAEMVLKMDRLGIVSGTNLRLAVAQAKTDQFVRLLK